MLIELFVEEKSGICSNKISGNAANMHGKEIDASGEAPVRLPWEFIGLEAGVREVALRAAGAVHGGKIRKALPENRAHMHGKENGAPGEAA